MKPSDFIDERRKHMDRLDCSPHAYHITNPEWISTIFKNNIKKLTVFPVLACVHCMCYNTPIQTTESVIIKKLLSANQAHFGVGRLFSQRDSVRSGCGRSSPGGAGQGIRCQPTEYQPFPGLSPADGISGPLEPLPGMEELQKFNGAGSHTSSVAAGFPCSAAAVKPAFIFLQAGNLCKQRCFFGSRSVKAPDHK